MGRSWWCRGLVAVAASVVVLAVAPASSWAASTVPPATYNASACGAVATYEGEVSTAEAALSSAADAFQAQPNQSTAVQVRAAFVSFLQTARSSLNDAADSLRDAGVPDVSGGPRVARAAISEVESVSKALGALIGQAKKIDTSSPTKFSRSFQQVGKAVQAASDAAKKHARTNPAFRHTDPALQPFVTYMTTDAKTCPSS
jgi:hypothetical protein